VQLGDWLGTSRAFWSYTGGGFSQSGAHAPFGESYAYNGGYPLDFTGQPNDGNMTNTTYYFPERQYRSSQGRWLSPDPAGLPAVDPTNPQSWNRYAYASNDPMTHIDPTGLQQCSDQQSPAICQGGYGISFLFNLGTWDQFETVGWLYNREDGFISLNAPLSFRHSTWWLTHRTPPNMNYKLVRLFDCFAPGDAVRFSTYSLAGPNGSVSSPDTLITENQLNPDLAPPNGQSSQAGGTFQDTIGPNGSSGQGSSIRYFTVSSGGQNLGVVPVVYENGSTFAYEGIWMNGDVGNPLNSQVFVNGSLAQTMRSEGSCRK